MGRKPLIDRLTLLDAIHRWIVENGMPPTVDELRGALGVGSTRTVLRHLRALEESGDIERWPGARGIRVRRGLDAGLETRRIPVVGQVAAGPLMVAEENLEGYVRLPTTFLRPDGAQFFLLRVRGDSMNRAKVTGEQIENGDLALVRQQSTADVGQVVVAIVDGEATVKQLQRAPGYWVLVPQSNNRTHEPIVVGPELRVVGVVQRVLKKGSDLLNRREEQ
jgi:repressor LexA